MSLVDQVYQAAPPSVVNDTIKPSREGTPEYSNRILFFKWKNESEFDELLLGKKDAVIVSALSINLTTEVSDTKIRRSFGPSC